MYSLIEFFISFDMYELVDIYFTLLDYNPMLLLLTLMFKFSSLGKLGAFEAGFCISSRQARCCEVLIVVLNTTSFSDITRFSH